MFKSLEVYSLIIHHKKTKSEMSIPLGRATWKIAQTQGTRQTKNPRRKWMENGMGRKKTVTSNWTKNWIGKSWSKRMVLISVIASFFCFCNIFLLLFMFSIDVCKFFFLDVSDLFPFTFFHFHERQSFEPFVSNVGDVMKHTIQRVIGERTPKNKIKNDCFVSFQCFLPLFFSVTTWIWHILKTKKNERKNFFCVSF